MKDDRFAFLERLMETICPSGYEADASRIWHTEAERFADRTWADQHGNTYAGINEGGHPRVMLAGHIDEIGLMITRIGDKGFLSFSRIGIWDPQILPGQRVRIRTEQGLLLGLVGRKPIHLLDDETLKRGVTFDDLWIDIGARDRADAESIVSIGDVAVLDYGFAHMRNGLVVGRGLDDRIGAFVVLEAARMAALRDPKAELIAVATVQEEIGYRGAVTSAFSLEPDVAIVVDVGHATDVPSTNPGKQRSADVHLGAGPVITRGPYTNHALTRLLVGTARVQDIPFQLDASSGETGTDTDVLQISRTGVATGLVSIPNRYMHSPCEMLHLDDLANAARLIAEVIVAMTPETAFV